MSSLPLPSEEEYLLKVLEDCEKDLVQAWCQGDLVVLCEKFFQSCIISGESLAFFKSLDHSRLERPLVARYLLRLARAGVTADVALWESLVEVLDTVEGMPGSLVDKLKQCTGGGAASGPTSVAEPAGPAATGTGKVNNDIILVEGDVGLLTELLAEVSHKWEELAISLGLLKHERPDHTCNKKMINLNESLSVWIAKHSDASLSKLCKALCSETVGESRAGEELKDKFLDAKKINRNGKESCLAKSEDSVQSNLKPRIVHVSLPTEVTDGKPTLLQVQARPREGVSYQWSKDGESLTNGSGYSGVDEDILVIRHASQGTEGEYTCCVSLQDRHVSSNKISLTVCYPPAKKHLLNLYGSKKEVSIPKDSWPPVVSKTFINLALIKSTTGYKTKADYSVDGNADKVIDQKEKVEYEDVFSEYKSRELILIEGRPGSGKTTLGHKIARDWALGEVLTKSKLTFLVTLRLCHSGNQEKSLLELLRSFYNHKKDLQSIVSEIEKEDGEGVCFVLDGLDEYQPANKERSVICKLLDRSYLPRSMVLVLTRPSASDLISEEFVAKKIEVFGFNKANISEYIDHFPFEETGSCGNSSTRARELKKYLGSHPNIHDMCYLPIHVAMICFLYIFDENISPMQTKVYEKFTCIMIQRHMASKDGNNTLDSLKDLKEPHSKYLKDLCTLAFSMTVESRQVVIAREFEFQFGASNNHCTEFGLGLLTICPTLQETGVHHSYAFLHLTFQEFLAAYHIANLDVDQQAQLIEQYCGGNMETVWLFYCGLIDFDEARLDKLVSVSLSRSRFGTNIYCYAFEAQQKCFCDAILKKYNEIVYESLTYTDLLALGYVIKTSSQPVTRLDVRFGVHDNGIMILLQQLQDSDVSNLHTLWLQGVIYDEEIELLCEVFKKASRVSGLILNLKLSNLHVATKLVEQLNYFTKSWTMDLNLTYSGTPDCVRALLCSLNYPLHGVLKVTTMSFEEHFHFLKYSHKYFPLALFFLGIDKQTVQVFINRLHHRCDNLCLKIGHSSMDSDCMALLAERLQHVKKLELILTHNEIDSVGVAHLAPGLLGIQLEELNLSHNNIGSGGAAALASGLQSIELRILNLSYNSIGPDGAAALARGLQSLKLYILDLSHNNIGPDGGIALATGFKNIIELYILDLSHNSIGPDGAIALAGVSKGIPKLRSLLLSNNDIGSEGAAALADAIKSTTLKALVLSNNNIGCEGAEVLACALLGKTGLEVLLLSSNNVGTEGAAALASAFQSTRLEFLVLWNNNIDSEVAAALACKFEGMIELGCGLMDNNIDPDVVTTLDSRVKDLSKQYTCFSPSSYVQIFGDERETIYYNCLNSLKYKFRRK